MRFIEVTGVMGMTGVSKVIGAWGLRGGLMRVSVLLVETYSVAKHNRRSAY